MSFSDYLTSAGEGAASGAGTGAMVGGGWGALVGGAIGAGLGIFGESEKESKEAQVKKDIANRPNYTTPDEQKKLEAVTLSRTTAQMPGLSLAKQGLDQSMASAIEATEDVSGGSATDLGAIQKLEKQHSLALSQLASQQAGYEQSQYGEYYNALKSGAGYADQAWDYNVNQKWQQYTNLDMNQYQAAQQSFGQQKQNMSSLATTALKGYLNQRQPNSGGGSQVSIPGVADQSGMDYQSPQFLGNEDLPVESDMGPIQQF
jgi:hypothetical protein